MNKLTLCVLFGGHSSEYEVSLVSAYSVLTNADPDRYDILPVGITKDGAWPLFTGDFEKIRDGSWGGHADALPRVTVDLTPGARALLIRPNGGTPHSHRLDVVFTVLHGAYGEDGTVQGMLALAGIPFVGCSCASSVICMDKSLTKLSVKETGIRQAAYVLARAADATSDVIAKAEEKDRIFILFLYFHILSHHW